MLEVVHIKYFRSCEDVFIKDIGDILALVGRNGVGKTNIMTAIEWGAKKALNTNSVADFKALASGVNPFVAYQIFLDDTRYFYTFSHRYPRNDADGTLDFSRLILSENLFIQVGEQYEALMTRDGESIHLKSSNQLLTTSEATPSLPTIVALVPNDPIVQHVKKLMGFMGRIRYYSNEDTQDSSLIQKPGVWIQHAAYKQWLGNNQPNMDANSPVLLKLLDMYKKRGDSIQELLSLLGDNGLGLINRVFISAFDVMTGQPADPKDIPDDHPNAAYFITFEPGASNNTSPVPVGYYDLSFGTRRIIQILVSLLYDQSSVMLIEQPEDGIHPGLLHQLMSLLKVNANPTQFILSSHSPAIFNSLDDPSALRLVSMNAGNTHVRPLNAVDSPLYFRTLNLI